MRKITRLGIELICVLMLLSFFAIGVAASEQNDVAVGSGYEQLNDNEKLIYLFLRSRIEEVADGLVEATVFESDADLIAEWEAAGFRFSWTREELGVESVAQGRVFDLFWEQLSFPKILSALLNDCPFELYWYDKTAGASAGCSMTTRSVGEVNLEVSVSRLSFQFKVASSYRGTDYNASSPCVDLQKTQSAAVVSEKADRIVAKYADASDYGKLIGYRDEICSLVSYNDAAASSSYTGGYGDPWQLIYVFDGDPTTNVVCEGYAKAFQYLCDLTDFAGDIACCSISGTMSGGTGEGAHMWNIVRMEDGMYYLVDVTNSDSGSIGALGGLFLAGGEGMASSGYTFSVGNADVIYAYASDTLGFWGTDGMLSIADADYQPAAILFDLPDTIVYDGDPLTAGYGAADIRYLYGGASDLSDQYEMTHLWYADADGSLGALMTDAPKDAGAYWIVVTAKRGEETHEARERIVISPAVPTFTLPTGLTAVYGQTLADVKLPEGFAWQDGGTTSVGNAGVNRFQAVYTPTDSKNYSAVHDVELEVTVSKKDISNITLTLGETPVYNGKQQTQSVTVEDIDGLKISYQVTGNTATKVGIYTLTVTGEGNYTGSVSAEWRLVPDTEQIADLTVDSVKPSDRETIEALKSSIQSDTARSEWAEVLAKCDALLAALDESERDTEETGETEKTEETTKQTVETNAPEPSGDDLFGCFAVLPREPLLLILILASAGVLAKRKLLN